MDPAVSYRFDTVTDFVGGEQGPDVQTSRAGAQRHAGSRHDRQSQGGAVFAPLNLAARARQQAAGRDEALGARHGAAGGADVPRQRLGSAELGGDGRRQAGVPRPGTQLDLDAVLAHYAGRIARWSVPDDVLFVSELPHTATGKVSKLMLREQLRD